MQKSFLERVQNLVGTRPETVTELSRILGLREDAIYRRLRGDSHLTLGEMTLLARRFNISIDSIIFKNTGHVTFSYHQFNQQVRSMAEHFDQINQEAEALFHPETTIQYACQDIPIFAYYTSPELFRFKMYVNGQIYWNLPEFVNQRFSFDLIPEKTCRRASEIVQIYNQLASTELWGAKIVDNTLNQIEYYSAIDQFAHPEDALLLCDAARRLIAHLRDIAEAGKKISFTDDKKTKLGDFHLYFNEFSSANDTILVHHPQGRFLFTTFGTPNFLRTTNEAMCDQVENWFDTIISRSVSISVHSGKERDRFFVRLFQQIQASRLRIEQTIDELHRH